METATETVEISAGPVRLIGDLSLPEEAGGLVVFAHGSGSSRMSPRNRQVARSLRDREFGTLLFDLLTMQEEAERANVFDIDLLTERLVAVTEWVGTDSRIGLVPVGYFGASTGAAAALCAAASLGGGVSAVVSRGGRPDLAEARLPSVTAPTLLIVGGNDRAVLDHNEQAASFLRCPHEVAIVPGATHLFEEPGALERVAELAGGWFERHLTNARAVAS